MKTVKIIDYFFGNIFSLTKAFEYFGLKAQIAKRPEDIMKSDFVVLPGVGAFGEGMKNLSDLNMAEAITQVAKKGNPILGICLGMQLLFTSSCEFGEHKGLNLIPGKVVGLEPAENAKVPHIGWASILPPDRHDTSFWNQSVLNGLPAAKDMYFVHSYIPVPEDDRDVLSITEHGEIQFCSCAKKENVTGCQFHPEKSGEHGMKIIQNFIHT